MRRIRLLVVLAITGALLLPVHAAAAPVPTGDDQASRTFDTPAPTARPTQSPRRTPGPGQTRRPRATPTPEAAVSTDPLPGVATPLSESLTVAYRESGLGQAPLLVALARGYFEDAGFTDVTLVEADDPLAGLRDGELDIAVMDARDAFAAAEEAGVQAIAGYRNYAAADGAYGGDLLLARPGMPGDERATVIAFLTAYVRALQDLSTPRAASAALDAVQASAVAVDPDVAEAWRDGVAPFAPFDGGFGAIDQEGGLGELATHLSIDADADAASLLDTLIAPIPLTIAQAWQGLPPNPHDDLAGAPGLAAITIGLPFDAVSGSPITVARDSGYFEDAGFGGVEFFNIEQPLPGVMTSQLDFGVVDAVDAADGATQGLPLQAIAGHANYDASTGSYGGDLIIASSDMLEGEASTVAAFLIAYVRGLRDVMESGEQTPFAPYDGGFGDPAAGGGLGELESYLAASLGEEVDTAAFVAGGPLEYAQSWWGLPANPTGSPPTAAADAEATTEEAA